MNHLDIKGATLEAAASACEELLNNTDLVCNTTFYTSYEDPEEDITLYENETCKKSRDIFWKCFQQQICPEADQKLQDCLKHKSNNCQDLLIARENCTYNWISKNFNVNKLVTDYLRFKNSSYMCANKQMELENCVTEKGISKCTEQDIEVLLCRGREGYRVWLLK